MVIESHSLTYTHIYMFKHTWTHIHVHTHGHTGDTFIRHTHTFIRNTSDASQNLRNRILGEVRLQDEFLASILEALLQEEGLAAMHSTATLWK